MAAFKRDVMHEPGERVEARIETRAAAADRPCGVNAQSLTMVRALRWLGRRSTTGTTAVAAPSGRLAVDTLTNEFWTSRQRAANSLHEFYYRACF